MPRSGRLRNCRLSWDHACGSGGASRGSGRFRFAARCWERWCLPPRPVIPFEAAAHAAFLFNQWKCAHEWSLRFRWRYLLHRLATVTALPKLADIPVAGKCRFQARQGPYSEHATCTYQITRPSMMPCRARAQCVPLRALGDFVRALQGIRVGRFVL